MVFKLFSIVLRINLRPWDHHSFKSESTPHNDAKVKKKEKVRLQIKNINNPHN